MAVKKTQVTRELEPELMTPQEQADMRELQMSLRGSVAQINGTVIKIRGHLMRPNTLMRQAKIGALLDELSAQVSEAQQAVKQIAAA